MDYQDLKNYIFQYISQFSPYKNHELYQVIINFFEEIYFKESYVDIPEKFKVLFEDHTLNVNLYDIVLQSLGYPKKLIESLPSTHKQSLLSNFNNYHNRKGSLKIIKEITEVFKDPIDIYELYIDFRLKNDNWDWYFIPKEVYKNTDRQVSIRFYDDIYYSVPTYYISKHQLYNWFLSEQISLPIKSNLLLMSMLTTIDSDELSVVVMMTALHYFRSNVIKIDFKNDNYDITLIGLYQLWNYLLAFYRGEINTSNINGNVIYFDISNNTFPYTLIDNLPNSISSIIDEYNQLEDIDSIRSFYKTYFEDIFSRTVPSVLSNLDNLRKSLLYSVDIYLIQYIENQLESATDIETEIISIMQELRESIKLHITNQDNELMFLYQDYILNAFELSILVPNKTTTYKLIELFKPFHTQLISEQRQIVANYSKFNSTKVLDKYQMFVIRDFPASACVISDDLYFSERINGNFTCNNNSNIITTTLHLTEILEIENYIFIRDGDISSNPSYSNNYSLNNYFQIIDIYEIQGLRYIEIESNFNGISGTYNAIYKRYHLI